MRSSNGKKKYRAVTAIIILLAGILFWNFNLFSVMAASLDHYWEIRFQGRVKETDTSETENAVPQSMAGNGNTIYLLKTRKTKSSVEDRSYIVKILDANTNSPKLVLPYDAAYVGHGNGMTYYNGYLYVADGEKAALYRVREEENSTKSWDFSTEWVNKEGTIHYEKNVMTLYGVNSNETIRNIAHYTGNYFIVCLNTGYSGTTNTLTYGVGLLEDKKFTIKKRFTVVAEDTYKAVQDIDYSDGYLWAVLYDSSNTKEKNNIHLIEIPTSFNAIEDGKTYSVKKTVGINKNEAGRSDTKNEIESVYIYGSKFYTWSNIREGWYETFCRYSRFPNGVPISSVTTQSKTALVIKWNSVSNVNQYRIDRRTENGEYETIATVSSSQTTYTDTGLTAGTKYYYRVYGINSAGTSPKKDGVEGVTRTETPKVSSVTAVSESELKVKWTAVTGAKKYIVCRKKDSSTDGWENYTRIKEVTGTEYLDTGLEPNTKYHYGIIAVTETGVESGNPNANGDPGSENRLSGTTLEAIRVSLNRNSINMVPGEQYTLVSTVTPAYASNSDITWTTSSSSVVSLTHIPGNTETIVAMNPGTATITAGLTNNSKKYALCTVTVTPSDTVDLEDGQTILNGVYKIRSRGTSQVLAVNGSSDEDGANIGFAQESESDYELFRFKYVSDGYYTIKNIGSGKYLEDAGKNSTPGAEVQQMEAAEKPEQLWQPVEKNGSYYLTPQSKPNLVLNMGDVDNSVIPYANLWIPKNSTYQLFELVPVSQEMNEPDYVLPADLTEIEEEAFKGIEAEVVYIPDNCSWIGAHAFRDSSVKQIRIPAGCELGEKVFDGCGNVTIFGTAGSNAQDYCEEEDNLFFVEE